MSIFSKNQRFSVCIFVVNLIKDYFKYKIYEIFNEQYVVNIVVINKSHIANILSRGYL